MPNSRIARLFATALLLPVAFWAVTWAAPAAAQSPAAGVFTADQGACYGRVYDQAHLRSHPRQKVTRIHVLRSLERRRQAENWTPDARAEEIRSFRADGITSVAAFVNFRDRRGTFHNTLGCEKPDGTDVTCLIECDGGSLRLSRAGANVVMLHNNGFILIGGCGEDVPEENRVHFSPGTDDKLFRLDAQPVATCRAEEQNAVPIPAGVPLRERFKEDEAFCFGRDYDANHLKDHPGQQVAQLRVGRLSPATERQDTPESRWWWFDVKLDVSVTLRSNRQTTTVRYDCTAREASWECSRKVESESPSACRDRSIHLVRGSGGDIMVYNRSSGLPIDKECETAATGQQFPARPATRSDDKLFRLTRMPIRQCQL